MKPISYSSKMSKMECIFGNLTNLHNKKQVITY
jgi:hypothetical protein